MKAREQETFGEGTPGLYYLRARCGACPERSRRDPTIGRFLTPDPLPGSVRSPQSLNPYPYVQNNPVNRVDPSGMLSEGSPAVLYADLLSDFIRSQSCMGAIFGLLGALVLVAFFLTPPFGSPLNPVNIQIAAIPAMVAALEVISISQNCGEQT